MIEGGENVMGHIRLSRNLGNREGNKNCRFKAYYISTKPSKKKARRNSTSLKNTEIIYVSAFADKRKTDERYRYQGGWFGHDIELGIIKPDITVSRRAGNTVAEAHGNRLAEFGTGSAG